MTTATALLYLEIDDEVTSVVRRIRETDGERVILVAPGRSRATSSVVALRLLARVGEDADRRVAVVGDSLTRSLASEAGLDAYASVDDARSAVLPAAAEAEAEPRGASIHVVRGEVADETAAIPAERAPARAPASIGTDTETRPVGVPRGDRDRPTPVTSRRPARRALPAAVLAGVALLLLVTAVLAAVVLPAATVTISPKTEPVGPIAYEIPVEDAERTAGTVEAEATVTATGTYPIQAAATGAVVFRNFNTVGVAIGTGTLVAAGEQAFETTAEVVVPAGSLTGAGTIQAGEAPVEVAAAAVGPAANVAADAIDTILTQSVAAGLRGFPNNEARLVLNPEPTVGGLDTTGPEFTQPDADAARAALIDALDLAAADALEGSGVAIFADPHEPATPVVDGLDGLVGTRDQATADISGTLAYDRLGADPEQVIDAAEARLLADVTVLPAGHQLVTSATEVAIDEVRREDDALVVRVAVMAASTPVIDRDEVTELIRGRSVEEAGAALTDMGDATVAVWPAWAASVPELEWRIELRVAGPP